MIRRSGSKDLFRHAEFQAEYPLSRELPYWDFFDESHPQCFALADGTLVQGLKLRGAAIETWDSHRINQLTTELRAFLNSLPDGADLQFFVDVNSDYERLVSEHEALSAGNALIAWITQARAQELRNSISTQSLTKVNLYLFVYLRLAPSAASRFSFFSKPRTFVQQHHDEFGRRARELSQLCHSLASHLSGLGVSAEELRNDEAIGLIYRVLNPLRAQAVAAPTLQAEHRDQEFTPEELAIKPDLAFPSPREQLAFSDLIQGVDSFFLDGHYHRVLTLRTLPEYTHAALVSRLMALPFHHVLSLQLQVPEQSKELSALQAKRRMAHSMSASHQGRVTDLESEAKLQSTEELIRELIQTGQKIFSFQLAVLLRSETREDLDLKTKAVLSRVRELNGAEAIAETVAGFKVFKTLLPAGNTTTVRAKRAKTDNLADFLPVYQPWEGDIRPVCLLHNRNGGLLAYDPYDLTLPNYNALVTGSSGSGKSFLNNCILLQYLAVRPLIYVIDIGGSYRKLCEFMGGQYIELTPPEGSVARPGVAVNPLLLPPGARTPSPQKIKFLLSLLETILVDDEGEKLPKLDKSLLEEAILQTYDRSANPTLSDLTAVLAASVEPCLKDYARMLYPWTGSRPYGRLLDAPGGLSLQADMVVFDLKGLSSYPDLQAAMILIITDFILGRVEGMPGRPKRILMDECWQLLKSRGASQFMEYCVRTLRKTGSGITFVTQGLEEVAASPIGHAILNNTATKLILMQRGDLAPIRDTLKLNDQEMSLIGSLRQQKGMYSEAFLVANENRAVIRLIPTPIEYWLATSDAADGDLLADFRKRHPEKTLPEAIHEIALRYPRGSQGVRHWTESSPKGGTP